MSSPAGPVRRAVLAPNKPGQPGADEILRLSSQGLMPRRDYVEVARVLGADVLDAAFMLNRASPMGRLISRRVGVLQGVLYEASAHRRRYQQVLAWADRAGLPLALLNKLTRSGQDLTLLSVYLSQGKKAFLVKDLRVHTHLRSIMYHSSVQMELSARELDVPRARQVYVGKSVDDRFWRPLDRPVGQRILSVGWEARDYPTLMAATSGLDVGVDIAVGTLGLWGSRAESAESSADPDEARVRDRLAFFENFRGTLTYPFYSAWMESVARGEQQDNVMIHHQVRAPQLREMYAAARVVVVPLHDVEFDAGVTSVTEALAMARPVIVTRTRGQVDVIRHGEHGFCVPPGDPRALREALQYLLDNPEHAERMGRAGRELVTSKHALDDYVARIVDVVTERTVERVA